MTNTLINEKNGILFMKVGVHANEPLDQIIARKTKEIEDAGYAMWGYGGNTCHPSTMVQPFAQSFEMSGGKILLCMQEMVSKHYAEQIRSDDFSVDGINWEPVPQGINVLGSRYALVIKNLRKAEMDLPLDKTVVAVGNSQGRAGDRYIKGRVDKACLRLSSNEPGDDAYKIGINLVAEISAPYAVFLRKRE